MAQTKVTGASYKDDTKVCKSPVASISKTPQDIYITARDLLDTDPFQALDLAKSLPQLPLVDDLRWRLLADAYIKNGKYIKALDSLSHLEELTDSLSERSEIKLERAEILFQQGMYDDADAIVRTISVRDFKGAGGNDRRYLTARFDRIKHDYALHKQQEGRAKAIAKQMLIFLPAEEATRRPGLAATVDDLSDKQRYVRGKNLYAVWQYAQAREEFLRALARNKNDEFAMWTIAMIDLRKKRDNPKRAEKFFKKLRNSKRYKEEATYFYARSLMRQERYDEALKVFDSYRKQFKRGKRLQEVEYYEGWLPYDHRQNKKAIAGFKDYIKRYGRRSRRSSLVYGFLAWAYMREHDWKNAIDVWDDMIPFGNPLVAGKAMYWKAYALDKLEKKTDAIASLDQLRKSYPLTYYQMLGEQLRSKIETGKSIPASQVWWPPRDKPADDSPRVDLIHEELANAPKHVQEKWKRVKQLALFDEKHIAREEFSLIKNTILNLVPKNQRLDWIHAIGVLVGDYNTPWQEVTKGALTAMTDEIPDSKDLRWVMAYPRSYPNIVEDVAEEFKVSPYFIWSIMRQESRYKPGALSHTNAVGALQMIPETAKHIAKELGLIYDVRTFFRPQVGFRYSGFYMRKLLDTFSGLYTPAAASYNSGPKPIARWFRKNPNVSFPWLIEEFEYNEGRAYCRKVTEHMTRYLYLYASDDVRKKMLDVMYPLSRNINIPRKVGY